MYVDGFLIPVKRDRIEDYRRFAQDMAEVWMRHGALSVVEAIGDDVPAGETTSFPMAVKLEPDEVVCFSWITYADRAARDRINAAVYAEARPVFDALLAGDAPMNARRMIFGGFRPIVQAGHASTGSGRG